MYDEHHCPVDQSEAKDHNPAILGQALSHASHGTQYALFNDECMATIKPNQSLLMQNIIESQSFMRKDSTKGGICLFLGFLFFYVAIKFMIIPMGLITIPRNYGSWLYVIFG
jgi:hypothetical protein